MTRSSHRLSALLLAALLTSCSSASAPAVAPTPTTSATLDTNVPSAGLALVVRKSTRLLTVFSDGHPLWEFHVVMGPRPEGPKRFEGDMRTPEGLYRVIGKRTHPRWQYFIAIDYPNDADVAAYAAAVNDGVVPLLDGEFLGIGGEVGIHGTDDPDKQANGEDWTRGCVAMESEDVAFVYDIVEPGTPVLILP